MPSSGPSFSLGDEWTSGWHLWCHLFSIGHKSWCGLQFSTGWEEVGVGVGGVPAPTLSQVPALPAGRPPQLASTGVSGSAPPCQTLSALSRSFCPAVWNTAGGVLIPRFLEILAGETQALRPLPCYPPAVAAHISQTEGAHLGSERGCCL